jgi:putative membrane protein
MLDERDRQHIADAVARAETNCTGEISCVLAEEASHYREVPLGWAALAALVLPPLGLVLGFKPLALAEMISGWAAAQAAETEREILLALSAYAVVQAVLFAVVALIVSIPAVRRALTPSFLKQHRTGQSARHHFAALAARLGADTPYVLIYASRRDRRVEIVASEAAYRATGDTPWRDAANVLTASLRDGRAGEGFVRAVEICGAALARHFPPNGEKHNALPDTLLET